MTQKHKIDYDNLSKTFDEYKDMRLKTDSLGYQYIENILQEDQKAKDILDFWCGSGNFMIALMKNNNNVIGVDISNTLLEQARRKIPNWKFFKIDNETDIDRLFEKDYFDIVIFNYVLCEIKSKNTIYKILKQVHKVLKPNWKVFIHNSNRDKSNGIEFITYTNNFKENLKEGDKIICTLKNKNGDFDVYDYFWSQETYSNLLEKAWFIAPSTKEIYWEENIWWWNEVEHSPCYVIIASK